VSYLLGGLRESGGQFYWGTLAPLGILLMFGPRQALWWFGAFSAFIAAFPLLEFSGLTPQHSTASSPPIMQLLHALNYILPTLFIFSALGYFIVENRRFYLALQTEQDKSQRLLLNVLPAEIADALKGVSPFGPMEPLARNYKAATIVFLDIVGFTGLSKQQPAEETLRMLNQVFSGFDAIVERYDLEKIKTIGDCYMLAAGIPRERSDHAVAAVSAALEMADYLRNFEKYRLSFRVGIHSGPVAAGVIGRKKFLFDVWGDPVNTASRMESHGVPGEIQISRLTFDLVADHFLCKQRGLIDLKGRGQMETWFVAGRRPHR
jgi:guanylate cyclase